MRGFRCCCARPIGCCRPPLARRAPAGTPVVRRAQAGQAPPHRAHADRPSHHQAPAGGRPRPPVVNVYAIVRAGRPGMIRTRSGHRLKQITCGPVAAVVRDVRRPPVASPAQVRLYERHMRELAERFPALLPARFATVMPPDELAFILSTRRRDFQSALAHVRGRSQMTVRVVCRKANARARHGAAAVRRDAAMSGGAYLRERAHEAAAQRVVPGFEPVRAAVARWICDERVEHHDGVSTIYHLVPRSSSARYQQTLRQAAEAAGLPAVVTGPWPPYAFTSA